MLLSRMTNQELCLLGIAFFIVIYGIIFAHEYFRYYRPALKNKSKGKIVPIDKYKDNNNYNDIW